MITAARACIQVTELSSYPAHHQLLGLHYFHQFVQWGPLVSACSLRLDQGHLIQWPPSDPYQEARDPDRHTAIPSWDNPFTSTNFPFRGCQSHCLFLPSLLSHMANRPGFTFFTGISKVFIFCIFRVIYTSLNDILSNKKKLIHILWSDTAKEKLHFKVLLRTTRQPSKSS